MWAGAACPKAEEVIPHNVSLSFQRARIERVHTWSRTKDLLFTKRMLHKVGLQERSALQEQSAPETNGWPARVMLSGHTRRKIEVSTASYTVSASGPLLWRISKMARKTKTVGETIDVATSSPMGTELSQVIGSNGNSLAAFAKASEALVTGMALIGREMMQFTTTRLQENMELCGSVLQCGDAREVFLLQCDHAKTATRQYLDQASKLMGLAAQVSERSSAPFQDATQEALDQLTRR
jgi:hypothetical protein